jgi:hypothetical protein
MFDRAEIVNFDESVGQMTVRSKSEQRLQEQEPTVCESFGFCGICNNGLTKSSTSVVPYDASLASLPSTSITRQSTNISTMTEACDSIEKCDKCEIAARRKRPKTSFSLARKTRSSIANLSCHSFDDCSDCSLNEARQMKSRVSIADPSCHSFKDCNKSATNAPMKSISRTNATDPSCHSFNDCSKCNKNAPMISAVSQRTKNLSQIA